MSEGIKIPVEWYFWPDEADDVYQAEFRAWQDAQGRGDDSPIPLRDVRRVVFLEHSAPGTATGQALNLNGGLWYAFAPSGQVIHKKAGGGSGSGH